MLCMSPGTLVGGDRSVIKLVVPDRSCLVRPEVRESELLRPWQCKGTVRVEDRLLSATVVSGYHKDLLIVPTIDIKIIQRLIFNL